MKSENQSEREASKVHMQNTKGANNARVILLLSLLLENCCRLLLVGIAGRSVRSYGSSQLSGFPTCARTEFVIRSVTGIAASNWSRNDY